MTPLKCPDLLERLLQLVRLILGYDLSTLLSKARGILRALGRLLRRTACRHSYEILQRKTTVTLCDPSGKRAFVQHRKLIRFLQDDVVAITDRIWGTGRFREQYRCSPGAAVDFYEEGSRWNVLISLRETKGRGDTLTFKTSRTMLGAFKDRRCWWEEEIYHPTKEATIIVIFPRGRRCRRATVTRRNHNRTVTLHRQRLRYLSDGRQALTWRVSLPQLHDLYRIQWNW